MFHWCVMYTHNYSFGLFGFNVGKSVVIMLLWRGIQCSFLRSCLWQVYGKIDLSFIQYSGRDCKSGKM